MLLEILAATFGLSVLKSTSRRQLFYEGYAVYQVKMDRDMAIWESNLLCLLGMGFSSYIFPAALIFPASRANYALSYTAVHLLALSLT